MFVAALVFLEVFSQIVMLYHQKHSASNAKKVPNTLIFAVVSEN